jgi:DNA-binding protein YbaB
MSDYHDQLDADVERADRKVAETGARVAEHLGRTGRVTGRASSRDGAISVVVAPGGRLVEVNIENSALTMRPEQLAEALVEVAGRATRNAGARMQQSIRSVVEPTVAESLARLGITPGATDEDVDWVDVIRRGGR